MLHGHEQGVEHNADGDSQVDKRVHHHNVHPLFKDNTWLAAVPLQEDISKLVPGGWACPMGLLQL